ncbi:hypothetical protein Mrose_02777 [Calidithermus roseus]|uniref:Uncharacterized protein n=1 Tax=Calidithermus roseus TaxID=1644118 RepID=A0A399EPN4_9DEIN|nr:hypothetical protein Mrose_02777 [Calidithermus roseus]
MGHSPGQLQGLRGLAQFAIGEVYRPPFAQPQGPVEGVELGLRHLLQHRGRQLGLPEEAVHRGQLDAGRATPPGLGPQQEFLGLLQPPQVA